jgi:hypothetical protein
MPRRVVAKTNASATPSAEPPASPQCGFAVDPPDPPPPPASSITPPIPMPFDYRTGKRESGGGEVCAIAEDNIADAERAVANGVGAPAPVARQAWDHTAPPKDLDLVDRRLRFTAAERALLTKNGFVVASRYTHPSYAWAYHEIFQSQLPIYVSIDSVLHAIFASNDDLIADLEHDRLQAIQTKVLDALACALPAAAASYPPEVARDLDLYVTVARSLAKGERVPSALGESDEAKSIIDAIEKAEGIAAIKLFGRARTVDFSAYKPRGHYAREQWSWEKEPTRKSLTTYFRAAMWLSRIEMSLVTRSCPSSATDDSQRGQETPREDIAALALADLAGKAGAIDAIEMLDDAWGLLAGKREDVSIVNLVQLRGTAGIADLRDPHAAEKLRAAIGASFARTARLHYVPDGCGGDLPAIATMLGPRVVVDTAATRAIAYPAVDRYLVTVRDIAYTLGHDRAKSYLAKELAQDAKLAPQLDVARKMIDAPRASDDLYAHWFEAIRSIAKPTGGVVPSFMDTEPYKDMRMNSAVAAFGQIRHNYVLLAGSGYNEGGCEIPDGYVEPAPAVYEALLAYAKRGESVMAAIDPKNKTHAKEYFARLGKVLATLKRIGDDELAGRPLSNDEKRFLAMVTEMIPATSDSPPTNTGWYFDLFRGGATEALNDADFIADFYNDVDDNLVAYAGAKSPRLGVFIVDTGGAPRAFVGPVARGFEYEGPLSARVDDAAAKEIKNVLEPWAKSYTAPDPGELKIAIAADDISPTDADKHLGPGLTIRIKSPAALGAVTIELLDHHFAPFESTTRAIGAGMTKIVLAPRTMKDPPANVRAIRVRAGERSVLAQFESWGMDQRTWTFGGAERIPYSWELPQAPGTSGP